MVWWVLLRCHRVYSVYLVKNIWPQLEKKKVTLNFLHKSVLSQ